MGAAMVVIAPRDNYVLFCDLPSFDLHVNNDVLSKQPNKRNSEASKYIIIIIFFFFHRFPLIHPPLLMKSHISSMRAARRAALPRIPRTLREFGQALQAPANVARFVLAEPRVQGVPLDREPFFRTLLVWGRN
jgi:hypothetical protein